MSTSKQTTQHTNLSPLKTKNILKTSLFIPGNTQNLPTLPTLVQSPRRAKVGVEDLDESLTRLQRKLGHVRIGDASDWNIPDSEVENLLPTHQTQLLEFLNSKKREEHLRAIVLLRKFVSVQDTSDAYTQLHLVDELQVYSRLAQLFQTQDAQIHYEIAWLLTNLCAGPTDLCWNVYQHCLHPLVHHLSSPNWRVRWQVAWCLGNIAGDSTSLRDALFVTYPNLVSLLCQALETNIESEGEEYHLATTSLSRVVVWVIGNLGRWDGTPPHLITPSLPMLKELLLSSQDVQFTAEVLRTLKYVLHEPRHEDVVSGLDGMLVGKIVECLGGPDEGQIVLALRVLTNITSGDDEETQLVIDQAPLIPLLPHLLHHQNPSIRLHAAFLISNLCAGSWLQVCTVLSLPKGPFTLLSHLISRVGDPQEDWKVRRESSWALGNLTDVLRETSDDQVLHVHAHLIKQGFLLGILEMIRISSPDQLKDAGVFLRMVDGLVNLLHLGEMEKKRKNTVAQYVESVKGVDLLWELSKNYTIRANDTPLSSTGKEIALAAEASLPVLPTLPAEFRKAIKNINLILPTYFSTWLQRKQSERDVDWLTDSVSGLGLTPSSKGKVIVD